MNHDVTTIDGFRLYCLQKSAVTEELPFGPDTLVFKVQGKIFALCDLNEFRSVNLKCDPDYAIDLREQYPRSVLPGYHMNKKHWNTVLVAGEVDANLLRDLVDHSYDCVCKTLPKSRRPKDWVMR